LKKAFPRFLVSGAANTALTYAAYLLLVRLLPYIWAYSIVYVAGIVLAYVVQTKYVFEVRSSWRSFMKFPLIYLVQYVVGATGMRFLVESGLLSKEAALLAVLCTTVPLGFVLSRYVLVGRNSGSKLTPPS
jgi:putative flippase GtrA